MNLGLFLEAEPCHTALALSPMPVGLKKLGNIGNSRFPAPLPQLLLTALSFAELLVCAFSEAMISAEMSCPMGDGAFLSEQHPSPAKPAS